MKRYWPALLLVLFLLVLGGSCYLAEQEERACLERGGVYDHGANRCTDLGRM